MYCKFYGLEEKPFNVTSDPTFFFLSKRHKEAFSHLVYGVNERKGILVITGEVGTGKTTLCRALLNSLNKETKTAFILNPIFSDLQLLRAVVEDFGLEPKGTTRLALIRELNKFLLEAATSEGNALLIIDEAQNLKPNQLEQIRLLSNLETEKEKLLQIILVGQPELILKLQLPNLRQLKQRIMVRYHILPLEKTEVREYIEHRLNIAGSDGRIKFSEEAMEAIYNFSGGTPRLINSLCDRLLLAGFVIEKMDMTKELVKKCVEELRI